MCVGLTSSCDLRHDCNLVDARTGGREISYIHRLRFVIQRATSEGCRRSMAKMDFNRIVPLPIFQLGVGTTPLTSSRGDTYDRR